MTSAETPTVFERLVDAAVAWVRRRRRARPDAEFVVYPPLDPAELSDVLYRASFYFRTQPIYYSATREGHLERPEYLSDEHPLNPQCIAVSPAVLWWKVLTLRQVLVVRSVGLCRLLVALRWLPMVSYVDSQQYKAEGAAYYDAYNYCFADRSRSPRYLDLAEWPYRELSVVFGSGQTIAEAHHYDFSVVPSYRIICNTIVKNRRLLESVRPHFVVCADAVHHFGPSVYAAAFRRDLVTYLQEHVNCAFLIPENYFAHFTEHVYAGPNVFAIPCLSDQSLNLDLRARYAVHRHGSILNRLQLPLASTLSDTIVVVGCDGRTQAERRKRSAYWTSHDAESNYPELMEQLFAAHPYLSVIDKDAYAATIAETTETIMGRGEQRGKAYYTLTESNIPALQARPIPADLREAILRRST